MIKNKGFAADPRHAVGRARDLFRLDRDLVHLNCMLTTSHPRLVQQAISRYQRAIDENPDGYIRANIVRLMKRSARKAGEYLELPPGEDPFAYIRQTESTTVGLAHLYNGIPVKKDQEILTTEHDFLSTRAALKSLKTRTGTTFRKIRLFRRPMDAATDEILHILKKEIRPSTRLLALTWVHSSTGLKLPIRKIGKLVQKINKTRKPGRRLLLSVDGVHGFGVENFRFSDLRCDFFVAGCHKWLFGPRGTAIVCGRPDSWSEVTEPVPSLNPNRFPGGVLPYEYHWAVAAAFDFHLNLGKAAVEAHTTSLAKRLKQGLDELAKVTLVTPISRSKSAGIVCCDLKDVDLPKAVKRLQKDFGILASKSSADANGEQHLRFSPSIQNTEEEIDRTIDAVHTIVSRK